MSHSKHKRTLRATAAIVRSIAHSEIVTLAASAVTDDDRAALRDAADGWTDDNAGTVEYWGARGARGEREWRVHVSGPYAVESCGEWSVVDPQGGRCWPADDAEPWTTADDALAAAAAGEGEWRA